MDGKEPYRWHKRPAAKTLLETADPKDDEGLGYALVSLGIISSGSALLLRDTWLYALSVACFLVGFWKLKTFSKND